MYKVFLLRLDELKTVYVVKGEAQLKILIISSLQVGIKEVFLLPGSS
jgi:hypothetical protein